MVVSDLCGLVIWSWKHTGDPPHGERKRKMATREVTQGISGLNLVSLHKNQSQYNPPKDNILVHSLPDIFLCYGLLISLTQICVLLFPTEILKQMLSHVSINILMIEFCSIKRMHCAWENKQLSLLYFFP